MRIVIASDHAAVELRQEMADEARSLGHEVTDLGPAPGEAVDYPVNGAKVGRLVASGEYDLGLLACGTGVGISIAANKVPGIRAVVCSEPYSAKLSRQHNDSNVLAVGARVVGPGLARMIVAEWLAAEFEGGRHARRVGLITDLETVTRDASVS
ncbi:MAG: ribose 5-phosphate isomerase B [Actinobacteria bacterium HGW-Actinobacteria-5]|jgi:ribose 5-phosphate isomerase B|nr:MAG: ribose 5-phosphate isomerase B [Actinobacteria bacterium HGW-Actinobacteria-5]